MKNSAEEALIRANLIKFREEAGFSVEQAARRAGLGETTVRAVESGRRSIPKAINLRRLVESFGHEVGHVHMEKPPAADPARIAMFALDVLDEDLVDDDLLEKGRRFAAQLNAEWAARRAKKRP